MSAPKSIGVAVSAEGCLRFLSIDYKAIMVSRASSFSTASSDASQMF